MKTSEVIKFFKSGSRHMDVEYGGPQGLILGPIRFISWNEKRKKEFDIN